MKVMAEEEPELAEVQFLRVEAEERSDISMEFQVAAVPTFLFFRAGTASFQQGFDFKSDEFEEQPSLAVDSTASSHFNISTYLKIYD